MDSIEIEKNIIDKINKGDEKALKILYDKYFAYLCACSVSYIHNVEQAKEIVNDVFMNIWATRKELLYPIHGYMLSSVRNGSLNYLRYCKSKSQMLEDYHKEKVYAFQETYCLNNPTPLQYLEADELCNLIAKGIENLPARCQQIFKKHFYEGFTPTEIAEELGLSVNTIRVQIKIALDRLKQVLPASTFLILLAMKNNM